MPRVPKDRTKYECLYCKERFVKMTDHMSHVIEQHDIGYRERGQRSLRPISCWGCGGAAVLRVRSRPGRLILSPAGPHLPSR